MVTTLPIHLLLLLLKYKSIPLSDYRHAMVTALSIHLLLLLLKYKSIPLSDYRHATVTTLLSCQPRVTVTSCFVYKVISDSESIDHLCITPIRRIG